MTLSSIFIYTGKCIIFFTMHNFKIIFTLYSEKFTVLERSGLVGFSLGLYYNTENGMNFQLIDLGAKLASCRSVLSENFWIR